MHFTKIQLIALMGVSAVFGHPASDNKRLNNIERRTATAFTSGNIITKRGGITSELYLSEITVGDQIGQGVDGTVYKAKVPGSPPFVSTQTYALKKDYNDRNALNKEFETYKAINGQNIGPGFEAVVDDDESENIDRIGILLEYVDARQADPNSKNDAKGALAAVKKMHDLGYVHGDLFGLGNYLVNRGDGSVKLVDFAKSEATNDARKKEEDISLLKMAFSGVEFDGDNVRD